MEKAFLNLEEKCWEGKEVALGAGFYTLQGQREMDFERKNDV